ncbi:MAG: M3 family metallopeptidase [Bacteriovoracaceae bacterium]
MNNPLLMPFENKFCSAPFDQIKTEHFMPALKEAIEVAKKNINDIKENSETPSFENTVLALEVADDLVSTISTIFFNLHSAESNDELQNVAKEFSPLITEFYNDIILDEKLFDKIKSLYEQIENLGLDHESKRLLEKNYKNFVRNGANLNEEDKKKLREIDNKLSTLKLKFGDNVLKDTNDFELYISDKEKLKGLPESALEAAAEAAKEKGKEGWLFTLDFPSYYPFMTYLEDRDLRKQMYMAYTTRAFKGGETDNREIVKEIALLRHQRAKLLGYDTHANFVLEERMASKPEKVKSFLEDLLEKAKPFAEGELKELNEFATQNGGPEKLENWDVSFYFEKLKKEKFNIDDELLKPYFKLENVVSGIFDVAKKLFGLTYKPIEGVSVYHPDVQVYEVLNKNNDHVGLFYADFFPRAGKRNGAWMTSYRDQRNFNGDNQRPHVSIVCNFTKPTSTKPSLLTFNEVTTLFHEFGHSLHGILANTKYPSLSGTNVYWDFVELPSQIMENWAFEKECLDMFAEHFESGEKIPQDFIQKIKDSANFHEGRATLRQLSFGLLDMAWHGSDPSHVEDVEKFEELAMGPASIMEKVKGTNMSVSFSHIFAGGYSAGYYSYKWAEVLDADAFEHFKEKGIFNSEVADKFKNSVLSKGGSEDPMELYKKFRGQEPTADALLKRAGLVK